MKFMLSILVLISLPLAAKANEIVDLALSQMLGTLNVQSEPYMTNGQLIGCQLVYSGLLQDWKYRNGKFIKVFGSAALMSANGGMGHTLKVGVQVLDTDKPNLGGEFAPPSRIYIVGSDFSTTLDSLLSTNQSDTPGATFAIFKDEPAFQILTSALEINKLTIGFNSLDGGSDLQFPIELDVMDRKPSGEVVRSNNAKKEFIECLSALIGKLPN